MITTPRLINMTPHAITLLNERGDVIMRLPPQQRPLRIVQRREYCGAVRVRMPRTGREVDVPVMALRECSAGPMPEPREGVYYIVSVMVAAAYPQRRDLMTVDGLLRDRRGRVIGCTRLLIREGAWR